MRAQAHPPAIPEGLSGNPSSFPIRHKVGCSHRPPGKPAASRLELYPFLHNIRPNVKTDQPSSSNRTSQPQYILPKSNTPIHDAQKLKKEANKRKQRMKQVAANMDKLASKFGKWNEVRTLGQRVEKIPCHPGHNRQKVLVFFVARPEMDKYAGGQIFRPSV